MPPDRIDYANQAPRCQHLRLSGASCAQPALRGRRFCRFHDPAHRKPPDYSLPMVEDAASLQLAVMQVLRALADRAVDRRTAALMLYGLQIACINLKQLSADLPPPVSNDCATRVLLRELQFREPLDAPPAPAPVQTPPPAATMAKSPASKK
jgi:hypothetical protein